MEQPETPQQDCQSWLNKFHQFSRTIFLYWRWPLAFAIFAWKGELLPYQTAIAILVITSPSQIANAIIKSILKHKGDDEK